MKLPLGDDTLIEVEVSGFDTLHIALQQQPGISEGDKPDLVVLTWAQWCQADAAVRRAYAEKARVGGK